MLWMGGVICLLRILRYVFSVLGLFFAAYSLITQNFRVTPYMLLFLGLMMLVMGLEEFQKDQKAYGSLFILVFLFSLYVSIQGFVLN